MTWTWILGLDPGVRDRNGIVVLGWRDHDPCVYIAEAYAYEGTPTDVAEEVMRVMKRYELARLVCDEGGMGKAYAEEMRRRHHIPIEPAEKHAKAAAIRLMNADLARGLVKVVRPKCVQLLSEWENLPWHENGMREADGYPCDVADAALYAWRACMGFVERPKPPPKTPEQLIEEEIRALEEAEVARAEAEAGREWWAA
jgi:hypothetical protein